MKVFYKFVIFLAILFYSTKAGHSQSTFGYSTDPSIRLLEAASLGDYPIVADCLKKGANVNFQNWDGVTALMYATEAGNKPMVKLLLEKGAKVNLQPSNGITALSTASQYGYTDIAEMLLSDSAQVNIADQHKATALHYASLYNNDTIIFMLLKAGANYNILTNDNESPLLVAALNGSLESAYLLIDAGADLNVSDKFGFTPLMLASQSGAFSIAELLINNGANINIQNNKGFSALSLAILNNHADIVQLLIDNGANTKETNSISLNAKSLALLSSDTSIINSIRRTGAKSNFFPAFKTIGAGLDASVSPADFMTGFFITQHDFKFNLNYNLGFSFRPSAKKINFVIPDYGEYQFMERRQILYFDLTKGFNFNVTKSTGINIGARLLYSFGKYRGTEIPINGNFNAAPQVWLFYKKGNFESRLGYHYSNYGEKELSKSHFSFGLIYDFYNFKTKNINRNLKWIE